MVSYNGILFSSVGREFLADGTLYSVPSPEHLPDTCFLSTLKLSTRSYGISDSRNRIMSREQGSRRAALARFDGGSWASTARAWVGLIAGTYWGLTPAFDTYRAHWTAYNYN